jgi:hypothetical protein
MTMEPQAISEENTLRMRPELIMNPKGKEKVTVHNKIFLLLQIGRSLV